MAIFRALSRRMFLSEIGRATIAVAILRGGLAACGDDDDPAAVGEQGSTSSPPGQGSSTSQAPPTATTATTATTSTTEPAPQTTAGLEAFTWRRVPLGNVSAYVLARSGEAVVVDTGNPGSAPQIEAGLSAIGLAWNDVGHVVLTHLHPDHIGSIGDVLASADAATGYAGAADIGAIPSPRPLTAVGDGDDVFGLRIIATPGHTAGHISVLDAVGGLLVAGDAINGAGDGVVGPNPRFTADMGTAIESAIKLGSLTYEIVVFGHGDPVEGGADARVAAMAAEL